MCFLKFPTKVKLVISGDEIRAARERGGLTQQELAGLLGVTLRTVGNWERGESVPRNRESAIRSVLAKELRGERLPGVALEDASDMQLLAELAKRLTRDDDKVRGAAYQMRVVDLPDDPDHYRLAADAGEENIAGDDLPHEP